MSVRSGVLSIADNKGDVSARRARRRRVASLSVRRSARKSRFRCSAAAWPRCESGFRCFDVALGAFDDADAQYDKNNPPPNLGFDVFGSLKRLFFSSTEISDFRNSFQVGRHTQQTHTHTHTHSSTLDKLRAPTQVCGQNRSVVIQTASIEEMHLWLNCILEQKLHTEAIIDSIDDADE